MSLIIVLRALACPLKIQLRVLEIKVEYRLEVLRI
jgi:hypothetical protein